MVQLLSLASLLNRRVYRGNHVSVEKKFFLEFWQTLISSKQEGAIKYKTFVGWAKQRVPIIREMGTAFKAFAHPTFHDNYLLKVGAIKWKMLVGVVRCKVHGTSGMTGRFNARTA
ncbi:MAG: hypothetical protein ACFCVB_16255 [Nodosilinea sp.]